MSDDSIDDYWRMADGEDTDFDQNLLDQEIARLNNALCDETSGINHDNISSQNGDVCVHCGAKFSNKSALKYHTKNNVCLNKQNTHICDRCGKVFKRHTHYKKHVDSRQCSRGTMNSKNGSTKQSSLLPTPSTSRQVEIPSKFQCDKCKKCFARKANLLSHSKKNVCTKKNNTVYTCKACAKTFSSVHTLKKHMATHKVQSDSDTSQGTYTPEAVVDNRATETPSGSEMNEINTPGEADDFTDESRPQRRSSKFENTYVLYRLSAIEAEKYDIMYLFGNRRNQLKNNMLREMRTMRAVKWFAVLKVEMDRHDASGNVIDTAQPIFRSSTVTVMTENVIDEQINNAYLKILRSFDAFKETGSGWSLKGVHYMDQTITKYNPLRGNCFQYEVPTELLRKRCLLNVTGPPALTGECFRFAVLAALHTNENHVGSIPWNDMQPYRTMLSFEGLEGNGKHMPVSDIPKFEALNTISVNVYGYEKCVFPIYVSTTYNPTRHVNLLLMSELEETENDDEVANFATIADRRSPHYCAIKDMGKLIRGQADPNNPCHVCMRCLAIKYSASSLEAHMRLCSINEEHIPYVMPTDKQKFFKFRNYGRKMKVSFVIYASFGWLTAPILDNDEPTVGYEVRERKVDVCAYSYHRVSIDNSHPTEVHYYRGTSAEDTMAHFLDAMQKEEDDVGAIIQQPVPVTIDDEGLRNIQNSNDICFVCKDPFLPGERIAIDHSHVSGKIRGRAHADSCNLRLKEQTFLPIVMQNLSHFEGRLIMQAVGRFGANAVTVIPQTLDTYVSIKVNKCKYLDFNRFLKVPLNELVESVRTKSGFDEFNCVKQHVFDDQLDVAVHSQVFCNDYLSFPARFEETGLPPIEAFDNRINNERITSSEYEQAERIWDTFQLENVGQYMEQHLRLQSLLFADVAEHIRTILMKNYSLDIMWYVSLPSFSMDSCLHYTDVVLELLQDDEMHQIIQDGIRGGVTHIGSPREISANNPEMPADMYDPTQPTSYIQFLDFNSLYPSVMADFPTPTSNFRFMTSPEIDQLDLQSIPDDADKGYILVVDLDYGEQLHDLQDQFPLAPENVVIEPAELSEYTQNLAERCGLKLRAEKRLCLTLKPKKKYAVHYLTLQLYIKHGLVVTNIHKVIEFTQTKWLQRFVNFTCDNRRQAQNGFDKMLNKNIANNMFGKTIENVTKRIKVKIVTNAKALLKVVSKPSFQSIRVFDDNVAAVQQYYDYVVLNKPISTGFTILELSKARMYQFYYEFLVKEFNAGAVKLIYSDTDSMLIHVQQNMDRVLWENRNLFDFSSLPENHRLKDDSNKEVPGKMKLQLGASIIQDVVCLSSKCYSVRTNDGDKSAHKGVTQTLRHSMYKECIRSEMSVKGATKRIRNYGQEMYHVSTQRTMLSPVDTKRFYISANESLSHGHYLSAMDIEDDDSFN